MNILLAGLGAGYLTYLLTISHARPECWANLQQWWKRTGPAAWDGKPITCMVCMSMWTSLPLLALLWLGARPSWNRFFPEWLASAAISLLLSMIMGALRKDDVNADGVDKP